MRTIFTNFRCDEPQTTAEPCVVDFDLELPIPEYVDFCKHQKYASEIHTAYQEVIQQTDDAELQKAKELAVAYNNAITPGAAAEESYSRESLLAASVEYDSLLNVTGEGTMGYVVVPKINVNLPIYHGTGNDSLDRGVGHLLGSSLPVGGESTHAILTGHSGMASQKMFTDLEQLNTGDVFYLQILNETLAYQVVEINTVLPYDTSLLGITHGEDYCTLVTCTPYGVNTHRLLVRGSRIPYEEAEEIEEESITAEPAESTWETEYVKGIVVGIIVVVALILFIAIFQHLFGGQSDEMA